MKTEHFCFLSLQVFTLFFTDGTGNRIAGSLYGSDRIIVIAGANKLVKDLNAGLDRSHFVAAQMN